LIEVSWGCLILISLVAVLLGLCLLLLIKHLLSLRFYSSGIHLVLGIHLIGNLEKFTPQRLASKARSKDSFSDSPESIRWVVNLVCWHCHTHAVAAIEQVITTVGAHIDVLATH
jgi:hypothetical protein